MGVLMMGLCTEDCETKSIASVWRSAVSPALMSDGRLTVELSCNPVPEAGLRPFRCPFQSVPGRRPASGLARRLALQAA